MWGLTSAKQAAQMIGRRQGPSAGCVWQTKVTCGADRACSEPGLSHNSGLSLAETGLSVCGVSWDWYHPLANNVVEAWMAYASSDFKEHRFHYQPIKYLQCFLILPWRPDKSPLCEQDWPTLLHESVKSLKPEKLKSMETNKTDLVMGKKNSDHPWNFLMHF